MSTLTKQWLQQKIADMEAARDEIPFGLDEDDSNTLAALRIALASLEAEAVCVIDQSNLDYLKSGSDADVWPASRTEMGDVLLYRAAPPAPVSVPAAMEMDDDFDSAFEHGKAVGWNAYRAAMLQGADGTLTNEGTIPVTQFNPVVDLYGLTLPTGGETSFTFDAVEARDFIDGGWSCQEYVELGRFQEAMLQNGNSPAQSDCCPEQNYIAPAQDGDYPVIPDGWIPVSERMPGSQEWVIVFAKWDNQQVLCWDDVANRWTDFEDQSYYADMFTHWMPLPAAPQQEDIIC
ncbi:DUF551 domain-containing protein [Escherichia coli]|uniref:DUF551 domain-containing protein n=1 Tax=Escherichia coli TaxID=562 RepID=UPI00227F1BC4|nr:DUF551 domain-containing protein [Escherichia coli]